MLLLELTKVLCEEAWKHRLGAPLDLRIIASNGTLKNLPSLSVITAHFRFNRRFFSLYSMYWQA